MKRRRIGLRATISMRRIVVVSAAAALLLAVPVGATADAGSLRPAGKPTPASVFAAIGHITTQTDAQIRAFWTPRRQQEALAHPLPAPTTDQSPGSLPAEPSGPALSAPGGSPTVRTQSAQIPAALPGPHSRVWTRFTTAPATTIGQLLFRTPSGRVASCTATVIAAPNKNTIWTAGHCVNDGHTHWYSDFEFVPGRWSVHEPFGVWTYYEVEVPNLWYYSSLHGYDFAAIALQVRSGARVANLTGYQGFKFGSSTWNWKGLYVFGYPTEVFDPLRPVSSSLMRYCTGDAWKSGFLVFSQENIRCDMGPGASGGPWLQDLQLSRGWGYLVADTSNHYGDDNSLNMRGPHLGSVALNVYNGVKNLP